MPRLRHYDSFSTARFITFTTYRRIRLLELAPAMEIVARHINILRKSRGIEIHGYVLMPEHIHFVITPPDGLKLGIEIGKMKARSAHEILSLWRTNGMPIPKRLDWQHSPTGDSAFWQRRCYDHNCRTAEIAIEKINYCHMNPVKQKLVNSPEEWLYSSYNWYVGKTGGPVIIDNIEF